MAASDTGAGRFYRIEYPNSACGNLRVADRIPLSEREGQDAEGQLPVFLNTADSRREGIIMRQIQWQDRFSIGVEMIDQAHHRLFTIVQKIMELYVERHEDKFACEEGIKYFKAYALKHFAEEEAYMREIGYTGYLDHKKIHDRMRREIIPALERELCDSDFSTEAVQHFIGVCIGWLTGHIMIEDQAILGKNTGEFLPPHIDDGLSVIHAMVLHPLRKMFGIDVQYVGRFSTMDTIVDAQYYELVYSAPQGGRLRFIVIIGEELMLRAAGLMLDIEFYSMNEIVRFAIREIAQCLIQRAAACFGEGAHAYRLEEDRFLETGEYDETFRAQTPQYSMLFNVKQECFALCIDRISEMD